jgi:hypothetical protein
VLAFRERSAEGAPEQAQLGQASIMLGQSGMQYQPDLTALR